MANDKPDTLPLTSGAALPWILEHLLAYPGSYEIPLRTMYTLNLNPTAQPRSLSPTSYLNSSISRETVGNAFPPVASVTSPEEEGQHRGNGPNAAALFKAHLMSQIAQLPSQPCSLPPSFVTSFVRRCFPPELEEVDFPQALAALDYLKDLESRRRKEVLAAMKRLGVTGAEAEASDFAKRYPGASSWLDSIGIKEKKVTALYTQVYLGLRRWTMINEMLLEPFNKANCIAMLNTLYPPVTSAPPTSYLTPRILNTQRKGFFKYILEVERNGRHVLDNLIKEGSRQGDSTGWPVVRDTVDKYLRAANGIIDECLETNGLEGLENHPEEWQHRSRNVDSGVSFGLVERPSTSSSASSTKLLNKSLPLSPTSREPKHTSHSTLEKIAKEIRKMRSRGDLREAVKDTKERVRSLKKMKSSGILGERDRNVGSSASENSFDADEFKRKRMLWEAKNSGETGEAK